MSSSFQVRKNEVCSLNNTPSPRSHNQQAGEGEGNRFGRVCGWQLGKQACRARSLQPCRGCAQAQLGDLQAGTSSAHRPTLHAAGLIGTSVFGPAADPASPRIITKPAAAPAAGAAPQPAAPAPSAFAWAGMSSSGAASSVEQPPAAAMQQPDAQHARSETVVVVGGGAAAAATGGGGGMRAPQQRGPSSDYLAALDSTATNPFETPSAGAWQREEAAPPPAQKAAQKQELLQQVGFELMAGLVGAGGGRATCQMMMHGVARMSGSDCLPTNAWRTLPFLCRRCKARSMGRRSWTRSGPHCWLTWTHACRWV